MDPFALLIFIIVGNVIVVSGWAIDDQIVRHVCRREARPYSIFWPFNFYWMWRTFHFLWFKEAREAGFFAAAIVVRIAAAVGVVAAAVLLPAQRLS